jgi:hypothetical protein
MERSLHRLEMGRDHQVLVEMVTIDGIITTVAGTPGSSGYTGDGGPAVDARLDFPRGVFGDENGRLFIADTDNNVIRMVDTNGKISTVAGTGSSGYSGDGGPAVNAELNTPYAVFVDNSGTPPKGRWAFFFSRKFLFFIFVSN